MTTTVDTASGPAASIRPPALPVELTTFIGREAELRTLEGLLDASRLLTLTGAGGSGKTRLAVELAARAGGRYPDGVAWVELAALSDPALLPRHVAAALGIPEDGGRTGTEALAEYLRHRTLLLLIDNCEHLADACAALADALLRASPGLTLLATSREALGVAGERAWLVPPLTVPDVAAAADPERLAESEAVRLFVARAQDVLPAFRLTPANGPAVAAICRRLDGVPLAIELAAARVRVLPPEQISQRLDNVFGLLTSSSRLALPRHRTLRATIDWSYQLLEPPARALLQRLSVFSGGCGIEAVEAVCSGDGIDAADVLDRLAELVDRSLVVMREHAGDARYSLLEIVRQYARDLLAADAAAREAALRRHAEHYAGLANAHESDYQRANAPETVARLALEQDNVRAALEWSLSDGNDLALAVRIVGGYWRLWFHMNHWAEGARWSEALVAAVPDRPASPAWVRALTGAGVLAYLHRDAALCRARLEEAGSMCRVLGDPELLALTFYRLAHLYADLGENEAALAHAEDAARFARETGDPWVLAEVLVYGLGFVHRMQGRADAADRAFAEAEALARASDARMALMEAHGGRAMLALERADVPAATTHAAGALEAALRLGDAWYISRALLMAAAAAARAGEGDTAARLLGCGAALREAAGTQVFPHEQAFYDEVVAGSRELLTPDDYDRLWAEGAALSPAQAGALVARGGAETRREARAAAGTGNGSGRVATPAPAPPATAPPALRVLALGPLEVQQDGRPLAATVWPYAKPRELLVLLMLHPAGQTREQIGRAIWPGSTTGQVKNSFHVTLHHLRKALGGSDWIVIDGDRYRIAPDRAVELDAGRFEAEARRLLKQADPSEETLREALTLYRGDLLEGEVTGAWVEEHRDRLRRLAVDLTLALGAALEAREDHAAAAELYRGLVAREDLNEEAHRRLMRAWSRAGDRARALQHYQRLVALLRDELDAEPEPETVRVYERLRAAAGV